MKAAAFNWYLIVCGFLVAYIAAMWLLSVVLDVFHAAADRWRMWRVGSTAPVRRQINPSARFHRRQTAVEKELQEQAVKLCKELRIAVPAIYVSRKDTLKCEAYFTTNGYAVFFNHKKFRGAKNSHTRHVLKHELVHAWTWVNHKPLNHGEEFQKKAREFGTA